MAGYSTDNTAQRSATRPLTARTRHTDAMRSKAPTTAINDGLRKIVTRVVPRSGTTQPVGLFQCPIGGTNGSHNTNVTEEYTYEAGEPHNRAA